VIKTHHIRPFNTVAMTFDPEDEGVTIYYNQSCNQYGAQIQQYFHGFSKND